MPGWRKAAEQAAELRLQISEIHLCGREFEGDLWISLISVTHFHL